ncbi:MAG: ECF transporter S component [Lachnospiraceae bacterium]|nr:ECF transporter S component [Lachnospiraceae bacterium]
MKDLIYFVVTILVLFVAAIIFERIIKNRTEQKSRGFGVKKTAMTGMMAALAAILMLVEVPLPFAPSFYKLDLSEVPVLISAFAFGPVAGVLTEFIKILLKLVIKGTSTAFVGELANFAVGCALVLPASVVYFFKKNKKSAILACITGTLVMTVFGSIFNAVYLLPAFSNLYGMPMEVILDMGCKVNPLVKQGDIISFVAACVAPLNLVKGAVVSIITILVYKHISPVIKKNTDS